MKTMTALLAALLLSSTAAASPNGTVPVQGQLEDADGLPVDGTVPVTFTLYRDTAGTDAAWADTFDVEFDRGVFTAQLGSNLLLDMELFLQDTALYLGIAVDGDAEMDLIELSAVPWAGYAHHAGSVEGLTRFDIEGRLQSDAEVESLAGAVCFDSEDELTAVLDDNYLPANYQPQFTWDDLLDRPADLVDGDDDTRYSAGSGLQLNGTELSLDAAAVEALATGVCFSSVDELRAELDSLYTLTVGTGLDRDGNELSIDTDLVPVASSYRKVIAVRSKGLSSTYGASTVTVAGQVVHTTTRSYGLTVIERASGEVVFDRNYDVYGNIDNADLLAADLAQWGPAHFVIINTYDEPAANRMGRDGVLDTNGDGAVDASDQNGTGDLADQMYRCGASTEVFGASTWTYRSSYMMIGICDMGVGTGFELYAGDVSSDPTSFLEHAFEIVDGQILR